MSRVSRETMNRAYQAFNEGDLDAVMELFDEHIEWRPPPSSLQPEPIHGHHAVRAYLSPDLFERQTAEPQEFIEKDNRVMVVARIRARGRGSGIEVDDVAYHVWTIDGGRIVRFEALLDRDQALAALEGR
jgi:ketosteroid isomerase-like protein